MFGDQPPSKRLLLRRHRELIHSTPGKGDADYRISQCGIGRQWLPSWRFNLVVQTYPVADVDGVDRSCWTLL
jgi:hypothetical protein